ncbi:MAG: hypothetical protein ACWA5W_09060 [Phycisphaerales bacterium]
MTTSPTQTNPTKPVVVVCPKTLTEQAITPTITPTITIIWEISRQAIAAHTPTPVGNTHTLILELAATQSADAFKSTWTLTDPITDTRCTLNLPALSNSPTDRIYTDAHHRRQYILNTHHTQALIERASDHTDTLLFVRTTLFGALNIPGGRYKPLGAHILDPRASKTRQESGL